MRKLFKKIFYKTSLLIDKKIDKKILIIESDDWGDIRFFSPSDKEELKKEGGIFDSPFYLFDGLERDDDILKILNCLRKIYVKTGKKVVITMNFIFRNLNYRNIYNNSELDFWTLEESYSKYVDSKNVIELIKQGIKEGYFMPQIHGLYHVCLKQYLKDIKNSEHLQKCAQHNCLCDELFTKNKRNYHVYRDENRLLNVEEFNRKQAICQNIFESIFGYKSKSYAACNHFINSRMVKSLPKNGINTLQAGRFIYPYKKFPFLRKSMFIGKKIGQVYISVRNVSFNPSYSNSINVDNVISDIDFQIKNKHPVVIDMHRLNFSSRMNENNTDKTLYFFEKLIMEVIKKYPNIEFASSDQFAEFIRR